MFALDWAWFTRSETRPLVLALTSSCVAGAETPTPTFVDDPEKIVPVPLLQVSP